MAGSESSRIRYSSWTGEDSTPRVMEPDYITALPEEKSELPQWQVAIEALMLVSRSGPTMLARIAFMKALNRNVVLRLNPEAKKHRWGKRKLKRDQ